MTILPRLDIAVADRKGSILLMHPERLSEFGTSAGANPIKLAAADKAIRRLRSGWRPSEDRLNRAPVLEDWSFIEIHPGHYVMAGSVGGHPRLGSLPAIRTSLVVALDATHLKWARTLSRFYRLGEPRPEKYEWEEF